MKLFKEDMFHPLLHQILKMASLCMNTSRETLSPFVSRLIHKLSAVRQMRSHSDTASVVLSCLKKSFEVVYYLFMALFHLSFSPTLLSSYRFYKMNWFLLHRPPIFWISVICHWWLSWK